MIYAHKLKETASISGLNSKSAYFTFKKYETADSVIEDAIGPLHAQTEYNGS